MNRIGGAQQSGALGVQRGLRQVDRGAATIASADQLNGERDNLLDAMVEMKKGKIQVQASVKTCRQPAI